jgi:hypothetical protein
MVIAKPEWFKKRRGGFWSYEMQWQGAVYMICTVSLLFVGISLPQNLINSVVITVAFLFLFMDGIIASVKSLDEREQMQYAISMRNAAWGMIIAMIVLMITASNFNVTRTDLYKLIMLAIFLGGMVGLITRYKLQR